MRSGYVALSVAMFSAIACGDVTELAVAPNRARDAQPPVRNDAEAPGPEDAQPAMREDAQISDAGVPDPDATLIADAEPPVGDAGIVEDAVTFPDAVAPSPDAEPTLDTGPSLDAGFPLDSGVAVDSGVTPDAGLFGCGDGVVVAPEICDDGNMLNGDGCNSDCTAAQCLVPITHPTVQAGADDAACPTVWIMSGRYGENINVTRVVRLVGVGRDPVVIDGRTAGSVITSRVDLGLENLMITDGLAAMGGGLSLRGNDTELDNVRVFSNNATSQGGGIYVNGGTIRISDSSLLGNAVTGGSSIRGGALYGDRANVEISDSRIEQNSVQVPSTEIRGTAVGGALAFRLGTGVRMHTVAIERTVISENHASAGAMGRANGGAISVDLGTGSTRIDTTIVDCDIDQNRAEAGNAAGGAISINTGTGDAHAYVLLVRTTVRDNRANGADIGTGGALYLSAGTGRARSHAVLRNSTLSNNDVTGTRTEQGGGIYGRTGTGSASVQLDLFSTTVFGNSAAEGGALWLRQGISSSVTTFSLRNSLFENNTNDACRFLGTSQTTEYNLFDVACGTPSMTDIMGSAGLIAIGANGGPTPTHALPANSPAIDSGNPAGCVDEVGTALTVDQRGQPRTTRCDIGAFELR